MSWSTVLIGTKEEIGAKIEVEKERLTGVMATAPATEVEDMRTTLERAKFYAEGIDLAAYNALYSGSADKIRVEAGGSQSFMPVNPGQGNGKPIVFSASVRLEVTPIVSQS